MFTCENNMIRPIKFPYIPFFTHGNITNEMQEIHFVANQKPFTKNCTRYHMITPTRRHECRMRLARCLSPLSSEVKPSWTGLWLNGRPPGYSSVLMVKLGTYVSRVVDLSRVFEGFSPSSPVFLPSKNQHIDLAKLHVLRGQIWVSKGGSLRRHY